MELTKNMTRTIGKQLYIEQYGKEEYDKRISSILPPEEDPRTWSFVRRTKEWFRFGYTFLQFLLTFSIGSLFYGRRITHTVGIAGKGRFFTSDDPQFKHLPMFEAGKEFPIIVRQADATYFDNASCVVRSCSVKFLESSGKNVLDVLMNSGHTSIIWNIPKFLDLMQIRRIGETPENLKNLFKDNPLSTELLIDNMYRVDTLTDLSYYSKIRYLLKGENGKIFACQFRCIPAKPIREGNISGETLDEAGN